MDLKDIRFGVEIETVKRTRKQVASAIQSIVGGTVYHAGSPTWKQLLTQLWNTNSRIRCWHIRIQSGTIHR